MCNHITDFIFSVPQTSQVTSLLLWDWEVHHLLTLNYFITGFILLVTLQAEVEHTIKQTHVSCTNFRIYKKHINVPLVKTS